jgi:uncharacterized membrane protein YhaH (DUF805 family)
MAVLRFFFGFEGRLARGRFWIFGLTLYALAVLATAFDPRLGGALRFFLWAPASVVLVSYLFFGMWGFAVAVLLMAVDLFAARTVGGHADFTLFLIPLVLCLVLGWMVIGVASKRLHDRGKSGWWLLIFVIEPLLLMELGVLMPSQTEKLVFACLAFALHVWSFVEMGCRRGTKGPNAYGPDPLAG